MINPTIEDIGRRVVYFGKIGDQLRPAYGHLADFDDEQVYVSYGENTIPLLREDLHWAGPENTTIAPIADAHEPHDDPDQKKLFLDLPSR